MSVCHVARQYNLAHTTPHCEIIKELFPQKCTASDTTRAVGHGVCGTRMCGMCMWGRNLMCVARACGAQLAMQRFICKRHQTIPQVPDAQHVKSTAQDGRAATGVKLLSCTCAARRE